jgi:hypothetical protein
MRFDEALTSLVAAEPVRAVLRVGGELPSRSWPGGRADPRALETISRAAGDVVVLWETMPLGEILPGLPKLGDQPVDPRELRASTYYALYRAGIRRWSQMVTLPAPDLRGHHYIGPKALHVIAVAALWHTLDLAQQIRQSSATRTQLPDLLTGPPSAARDRIYAVLSRYVREPRLLTVLAEMLYLSPGMDDGSHALPGQTPRSWGHAIAQPRPSAASRTTGRSPAPGPATCY